MIFRLGKERLKIPWTRKMCGKMKEIDRKEVPMMGVPACDVWPVSVKGQGPWVNVTEQACSRNILCKTKKKAINLVKSARWFSLGEQQTQTA